MTTGTILSDAVAACCRDLSDEVDEICMRQDPREWVREWFDACRELCQDGVLTRDDAIAAQCELASLAMAAWEGRLRE